MGEQKMLDSLFWHIRSRGEIERTFLFTLSNYVTIFLLLLFAVIAINSNKVEDCEIPLSVISNR
jgi:hypothetical protein